LPIHAISSLEWVIRASANRFLAQAHPLDRDDSSLDRDIQIDHGSTRKSASRKPHLPHIFPSAIHETPRTNTRFSPKTQAFTTPKNPDTNPSKKTKRDPPLGRVSFADSCHFEKIEFPGVVSSFDLIRFSARLALSMAA
jgi:hypothetical protein